MSYVFLVVAIAAEVVATTALQASAQFTRLVPSIVVVVGYSAAIGFLGLSLKTIPVGIAYAIWSGLGIALIATIGAVVFGQRLDAAGIAGLMFILTGIVIIQVFSNAGHP